MLRMVPEVTQMASQSCRKGLEMQNISEFVFMAHMGAMLAVFPLMGKKVCHYVCLLV